LVDEPGEAPAKAALDLLDAYMAAFNARDLEAFEATLNHPHASIGAGALVVTEAGRPSPAWAATGPKSDWGHSTLDRRSVIHAGPDKVHIDARITRFRRDGSPIGTYDVVYVITRENGSWGMKALSGLEAPPPKRC
jgi:hypothetical protein